MSDTQTIESHGKVDTGLTDSTHSSSSSAERYRLDEFDGRPVLVYEYRGSLGTSSQKDICAKLDRDSKLRVTKKAIPRYSSHVEVKKHDLYLPEEKEAYRKYPNYDASLASIKVPSLAYWSRLFFGSYDELYIVSPESTPSSSVIGDDDSRRMSPTSTTWGQDSEVDAKLGAIQEQREKGGTESSSFLQE